MCDGLVNENGFSSAVTGSKATLWQRGARSKSTNSWGKVMMEKGISGIFTPSTNLLYFSQNG
jgi:hypothetical protein